MDLTVIILNFNVRYLLESCLESLIHSLQDIASEIIVVDNASTDESVEMVRTRFPQIKILINEQNLGFAKANNQAIRIAGGKNLLILNPDTLVNRQAITKALNYLQRHDDAGAIGVRMLDGQNKYLKESKRGFPTVWSSFWKLTGINRLFPDHAGFNHYYLGHLSEHEIHEVEVLTGAFIMIKKNVLEQLDGFDESYFMYGEDIDLSYRIRQLKYKLIYLGTESIIHLKGRSSSAHSYLYVFNFYKAMQVFIKKYYRNSLTRWMMMIGIWLTGIASWIKRKIFFHFLPLTDLLIMAGSIFLVQYIWANYWFEEIYYFRHMAFLWNASGYILIWWISLYFIGAYRIQQASPGYLAFKGILSGTAVILIVYSLLPETWRTSRAIIVLSGLILAILLPLSRLLLKPIGFGFRALFIGDRNAELKLNPLFRLLNTKNFFSYISRIEPPAMEQDNQFWNSTLQSVLRARNITHVILNRNKYWRSDVLQLTRSDTNTIHLIVGEKDNSLLEDLNFIPGLEEINIRLNTPWYRLSKRVMNVLASILILPWGWLIPSIRKEYINLLSGKKQWVSYQTPVNPNLPLQKQGIWKVESELNIPLMDTETVNFEYAKNYHPFQDIRIILINLFKTN